MISTASALSVANTQLGCGPNKPQTTKVTTAMASTASTNQPATTSARRCIGARERCACATIATICESIVSAPMRSACITSAPLVLIVAPTTLSPARLRTGIGSPVSIDSSIELSPSMTTPSTGTFSPGRMRSRSPTCTWLSGMSPSVPSSFRRRAVFGARPSNDFSAAEVWPRAFSSSIWPSSVSDTITAAASKYTPTRPCAMNDSGNHCGAIVATTL